MTESATAPISIIANPSISCNEGIQYINTYKEDLDLLNSKEQGISRLVYKYYKPWLIYHEGLYLFVPNKTLWEEQIDNTFALVRLPDLLQNIISMILQKIHQNLKLAKEKDTCNVKYFFEDQLMQINKVTEALCKNTLKFAITANIIALLQANPVENFQGFNRLINYLPTRGNKVVNMKTGEILDRLPGHYFSTETTVEYIPGFHKDYKPFYQLMCALTLEDIVPEEERVILRFLQETMGYCASGANDRCLLFLFIGDGANGKSQFLKIFMELLGDVLAKPAHSDVFARGKRNIETAQPMLNILKDCRFAAMAVGSIEDILNDSKIIQATGEDQIISRTLYTIPCITKRPMTTYIYPVNELPEIKKGTANERRILVVNFNTTFVENPHKSYQRKTNPEIKTILNSIEFKKAYLSWIIEGTMRGLTYGYKIPEVVKLSSKKYHLSNDPLNDFIDQYIVETKSINQKEWMFFSEFRNYYHKFCKLNDKILESDKAIGTRLKLKYNDANVEGKRYNIKFKDMNKLLTELGEEESKL